jgi:hypothetical protein
MPWLDPDEPRGECMATPADCVRLLCEEAAAAADKEGDEAVAADADAALVDILRGAEAVAVVVVVCLLGC